MVATRSLRSAGTVAELEGASPSAPAPIAPWTRRSRLVMLVTTRHLLSSLREREGASADVRQHALAEEAKLAGAVVAPELEHEVGAAGVAVLLDRGNAVVGRARDRLALVEDLVRDRRLRGQPAAALHRLGHRDDLVLRQARALQQRVGGRLDVLHLVGEVHTGDFAG